MLDVGCRQLAVGSWQLAVGKREIDFIVYFCNSRFQIQAPD
jgi:hypothetical protein